MVSGGSKLAAGESYTSSVGRFAVIAAVVLVAFTALIARKLRQGERPPCTCFGAWPATPIGRGHLLRNAALIAAALVAAI